MKGTLEIIPIKIRDTIDKKEDIEGLRYCLQFEDLEETELPKKEELNKIRIAAKEKNLKAGFYEFEYDNPDFIFFVESTKPENMAFAPKTLCFASKVLTATNSAIS